MNPSTIPGQVNRSGSHRCSASNAARATTIQQKIAPPILLAMSNERAVEVELGAQLGKRQAISPQAIPTAASTNAYRHPIQAPQVLHRPRNTSQLTSGTFSHQASVRPQLRQCEGGLTMLSPTGQRVRHTFRKLPKASPSSAANTVPKMRIIRRIEYTVERTKIGPTSLAEANVGRPSRAD